MRSAQMYASTVFFFLRLKEAKWRGSQKPVASFLSTMLQNQM